MGVTVMSVSGQRVTHNVKENTRKLPKSRELTIKVKYYPQTGLVSVYGKVDGSKAGAVADAAMHIADFFEKVDAGKL
jgi:hypothetical protein